MDISLYITLRWTNQSFYGYCMWDPIIVIYTSQQQKLGKTRQWWITAARRRCACRAVLYWVSYVCSAMIIEALGLVILILEVQVDWEYELWLYFTVTTPFRLYILRASFQEYSKLPLNFGWYYTELSVANAGYAEESVASPVKSGGSCNVQKTRCMWWLNVVCMETIRHWWHSKHCSFEMIGLRF